jgi:ATP-dependent Clp protease ATP-binding subunit ClpX
MAIERKTGARGLRSIMEKVMMEEMFEIPSDTTIIEVVVTKDSVLGNSRPRIIRRQTRKKAAPALPAGEAGALKEAN